MIYSIPVIRRYFLPKSGWDVNLIIISLFNLKVSGLAKPFFMTSSFTLIVCCAFKRFSLANWIKSDDTSFLFFNACRVLSYCLSNVWAHLIRSWNSRRLFSSTWFELQKFIIHEYLRKPWTTTGFTPISSVNKMSELNCIIWRKLFFHHFLTA